MSDTGTHFFEDGCVPQHDLVAPAAETPTVPDRLTATLQGDWWWTPQLVEWQHAAVLDLLASEEFTESLWHSGLVIVDGRIRIDEVQAAIADYLTGEAT